MSEQALVRLPPVLADRAAAAAAADGLTVAAWLRALAVEKIGDIDPREVRPSPPRRGLPPEDVVAVARLRESLGEAVGALVRSAAFTREGGQTDVRAELELLIPAFREHALALDRLKAALLDGTPSSR